MVRTSRRLFRLGWAQVGAMLALWLASVGCAQPAKVAPPPPPPPLHDVRRDEKDLVRLEEDLHVAYLRHDVRFLGQILSEDFLAIDGNGNSYDRARQLAELADPTACEYITPYDMRVKVYGDAAVVSGRTKAKCRTEGTDVQVSTRWTDVFIRRDHRWKWVAAQFANLAAP